jgi:hypothetical protein
MPPEGTGHLVLYRTEDGRTRISCRVGDDSVWLTQAAIADLFQTTPQNITLHIGAIYQEEELSEDSTCKEYLQVRQEGSRRARPKHCRGSARRKSHSLRSVPTRSDRHIADHASASASISLKTSSWVCLLPSISGADMLL